MGARLYCCFTAALLLRYCCFNTPQVRGLAAGSSSCEDASQARHDERWQVACRIHHRIRTAYAPHTHRIHYRIRTAYAPHTHRIRYRIHYRIRTAYATACRMRCCMRCRLLTSAGRWCMPYARQWHGPSTYEAAHAAAHAAAYAAARLWHGPSTTSTFEAAWQNV
jgi:hypothetical protein